MTSKEVPLSTVKALQKELKDLNSKPMEGFIVNVDSTDNILTWNVVIYGPPMTLYEGGYFKACLKFPENYPYSPPSFCFTSKMFHPNIYACGKVCISILDAARDSNSASASIQWNPTQNVRTILLSVISLLNEPNINSPANVDASLSYRRWKGGKDNEYAAIVKSLVEATYKDAEHDGIVVPKTLEEYCVSGRPSHRNSLSYLEISEDFDYGFEDDDVFVDDEECDEEVKSRRPSKT